MSPLEASQVIPWKRFWCRFGESIHVGDKEAGFLTDPEATGFYRTLNSGLRSLGELLSEPCLVLCGDPGMGKSTELQQCSDKLRSLGGALIEVDFRDVPSDAVFIRRTFDSPEWKAWQTGDGKLVLVVDGVDEGMIKIPDFLSFLRSELRNQPICRLQLILACRSAEWPDSEGRQLLNLWGAKEKQPIFELCPLRQCDAELGAQARGVDGRTFIEAAYQQKVIGLAALPTTLFFLLAEFRNGGQFSGTHRELYERGCERLAREPDARRQESLRRRATPMRASTEKEILEAASRVAALLLVCGKSAVRIGPPGQPDAAGDLHISEAVQPFGLAGETLTEDMLWDAITTALFTSRGANRLGFAHQTFAECLAARFLSRLPLVQIRKLVCAHDAGQEHVIPQLAETAGWLAGMREDFFDFLCRVEPEALLRSDVSRVQSQRKESLVAAVLNRAKVAELFDDTHLSRFFSSLKHPALAGQLRAYINDKSLNTVARRMAMEIAGDCKASELTDDLLRIVHDQTEGQHLRERAARALEELIPDNRCRELLPLAQGKAGPDPDESIRGCALRRVFPSAACLSEIIPLIHPPKNGNHFGSYWSFLHYDVPRQLQPSDLPLVLGKLIRWRQCFDSLCPLHVLAEAAFTLALKNLSNPVIRQLAVRVWIAKGRRHQPLPRSKDSPVLKLLNESEVIRRDFLSACFNDSNVSVDEVWLLQGSYVSLLCPHDLVWALEQIPTQPAARRAAWAGAVSILAQPDTACKCWDLLLDRIEEVPELKATFAWLRTWKLAEPEAEAARAHWQEHERWREQLNEREEVPDIEGLTQECIRSIESGKANNWIWLCNLLSFKDGRTHHPTNPDVEEFPGWKQADQTRRNQIRSAARNFLINHHDGYSELKAQTNFCYPGVVAIWFLRDDLAKDAELAKAVGLSWIDALVGGFNDGSEHFQETAAIAYRLNPDAALRSFLREVVEDNDKHGRIHGLVGFTKAWDIRFTAAVIGLIHQGGMKPGSIESILSFVAKQSVAEAATCAQALLSPEAFRDAALMERTIAVLSTCLGDMPTATWHFAWPIVEADAALAEKVMLHAGGDFKYESSRLLAQLTERQLADFYLKVRSLFPPAGVSELPNGVITARQSIGQFRNNLISALEARGTDAACSELLRIADRVPEDALWVRWRYYNARTSKRRKTWLSPTPELLLRVALRSDLRLVNDADDLLEVIVESLERLQVRLTQSSLPRSEDLWHWEGADTNRRNFRHKDEAYLSDYVASWLTDDLEKRGIVAGRELQLRRGQRTDIHVTAVPSAGVASPTKPVSVVIEIKGCWNVEVPTAVDKQLVGDYLRPNGLLHGIYLVGWFLCPQWGKNKSYLKSSTFAEGQAEIAQFVGEYDGGKNPERVRGFLLDCSLPITAST